MDLNPNNDPQQPQQTGPATPGPAQPANSPPAQPVAANPQQQPLPAQQPQTVEMFGEQHKVAAFMNPANPNTPQPRRSHKKLMIVVAVLVIAGAAVAGFLLTRSPEQPQRPDATQQSDTPEPEQQTTVSGRALASDITLTAAPSFVIPDLTNWQKSERNTELDRLDHTGGCSVTFTQLNERSNEELSDADATDKIISNHMTDLEKTGTISETKEGTTQLSVTGSDSTIEFKTNAFKYSTDLAEYRSIITVRSIDGYIMGVRFFCQTPAFSDNLNNEVVDALTITLPEKS